MRTKREDRTTVRESVISFVVTENEKSKMWEAADKAGITLSALARLAIKDYICRTSND